MDDSFNARPRRSAWMPLAALLVAFLCGVALVAWGVNRSNTVARFLRQMGKPPAAVHVLKPAPVAVPTIVPVVPAPAPLPVDSATQEELSGRLAAIESRIDAIDARAAAASGDADRADGLLVTFAARRQLDKGRPLGFLEGMLRDRFGATDAPAVAMVIASAQRPVTLAALEDALAALAPALAVARADTSWWASARAELGSLFVVRRADAPAIGPADRVARAVHLLEQGQVDAASAEVSRLPGSSAAADWLAAARRYSLARQALDRLETSALLKPREAAAVSTAD